MNKHIDEARLDRSLARQIRAPKLDRRFNAGVWARIEAEQRASVPVDTRSNATPSWLRAINTAGVIVTGILVAYFGVRLLSGVQFDIPAPQISMRLSESAEMFAGWVIAAAALIFGLMLTPMGQRMRTMFR